MKPLHTALLVLGTAALVATGYYYTTRTHTPAAQHVPTPMVRTIATHVEAMPSVATLPVDKPVPPPAAKRAKATTVRTPKKRVQGPANIPAQAFRVHAHRDTVLTTAGGCTLQVPANAFVDMYGKAVRGAVQVEVKEVLKPVDFVLGNMLTVYNGKPLESGGTFSITATARGQELALAEGAALNMAVPSRSKKAGMKFFPGKETPEGVEWLAPEALEAPVAVRAGLEPVAREGRGNRSTNVTYSIKGFWNAMDGPQAVHTEVSRIAFENGGLWVPRDTTFMIGEHEVTFFANKDTTATAVDWVVFDQNDFTWSGQAGVNTFNVDEKTNYVFAVKQLGWANIDRLLNDKRTRPVELITNVSNNEGMEQLCITLVMKSHGMYLPGYQQKNGSYGFSHGDYEQMRLPVGATATVLCTATKDGQPWYALQEITIAATGSVDLTLVPTADAELREVLMAEL
jgi:hypothetical protein